MCPSLTAVTAVTGVGSPAGTKGVVFDTKHIVD